MSERGLRIGDKIVDECGLENCLHRQFEPHYHGGTARKTQFSDSVWEIMDEIGNLLITKQSDYGPGNVNNAFGGPINGLLVRIGDKFERLKNLFASGKEPKHESIEDSFKDMANYAVIALMVQRGTWPQK
jgi:hypothetical protein